MSELPQPVTDTATAAGPSIWMCGCSIAARNAARKAKNFAEADRIRDELAAMGIELKDAKDPKTGELDHHLGGRPMKSFAPGYAVEALAPRLSRHQARRARARGRVVVVLVLHFFFGVV